MQQDQQTTEGRMMARTVRLDSPGSIHHVMGHAIRDELLFPSCESKQAFVSRLGRASEITGCSMLAWALMGSHYHLLVRTGPKPLWKLMHLLLTSYSVWFNKTSGRTGPVMRGRYRSILIDTDRYLQEVIKYIHLNPYRAGYVEDLDRLADYVWSGHAAVVTGVHPAWHDIDAVRSLFSVDPRTAVVEYLAFLADSSDEDYGPDRVLIIGRAGLVERSALTRSLDHDTTREHLAGSIDFGRRVAKELEPGFRQRFRTRTVLQGDLENLFDAVEKRFSIRRQVLLGNGRSRRVSIARSCAAWHLTSLMGMPCSEAGRLLNMTSTGVYLAARRWEADKSPDEFELAGFLKELSPDPGSDQSSGSSPEKKTR
jgi:putative transposase